MSPNIFDGGIPTGPEVEKVISLWQKLKAGEISRHEDLQKVLGLHPRSARYRTVIQAARKKFKSMTGGVHMLSVSGEGYQFPTGNDQIDSGVNGYKRIARRARRESEKIAEVADDRLDEKGKVKRDFIIGTVQAIANSLKAETRKICMVIRPTALPPVNGQKE